MSVHICPDCGAAQHANETVGTRFNPTRPPRFRALSWNRATASPILYRTRDEAKAAACQLNQEMPIEDAANAVGVEPAQDAFEFEGAT